MWPDRDTVTPEICWQRIQGALGCLRLKNEGPSTAGGFVNFESVSRVLTFGHFRIATSSAKKRQDVIKGERVGADGYDDSRTQRRSRERVGCRCGSDGVESSRKTEDFAVSLGFRESVAVRVLFDVEASKALIRTRKFL